MPFRKIQSRPVEILGKVETVIEDIADVFTGECQSVPVDQYKALPDASLGDLKTLLQAKVDLKEVNTKVFGIGSSVELPIAQASEKLVENKVEKDG